MTRIISKPLFFQRRFWPLWTTLSLGTFADNTLRQALVIGITFGFLPVSGFSRADNALPIVGALLPAGILSFCWLSGQLADKYETSLMLRRTKFTEIILMSIAAGAFIGGNGSIAILALFLMGVQSAFFSPVRVAAMPKYLAIDELIKGNGLCNAGLFSFILAGYAVGGTLIALSGGGVLVGVTLFIAALLGWLASLRAPHAKASDPVMEIDLNPFRQTTRMFVYASRSRGVMPPLMGIGMFFFLTTAMTVLLPLFTRITLNGDAFIATALNGLFAVGAGLGAIATTGFTRGRSALGLSVAGMTGAGILTVGVALFSPYLTPPDNQAFALSNLFTTPEGIALCIVFVMAAACLGLYITPLQAALQRRALEQYRARIMAANIFTSAAFAIPGSFVVSIITHNEIDPRFGFMAAGIGMIAIALIMIIRRLKLPAGLYDEMLQTGDKAPAVAEAAEAIRR